MAAIIDAIHSRNDLSCFNREINIFPGFIHPFVGPVTIFGLVLLDSAALESISPVFVIFVVLAFHSPDGVFTIAGEVLQSLTFVRPSTPILTCLFTGVSDNLGTGELPTPVRRLGIIVAGHRLDESSVGASKETFWIIVGTNSDHHKDKQGQTCWESRRHDCSLR